MPADRILGGQNTAHTSLSDLTSAITTLNGKYGENWGGVGIWAYTQLDPSSDWPQQIYDALHASQ